MRNVKRQLSAQAENILPDKRIKEDLIAEINGDEQLAYAGGGTQVKHNKKGIYAIIAAALAVVIVLCVTLPLIFKDSASTPIPSVTISATATDSFYAYGAASAGSILAAKTTQNSASSTAKNTARIKAKATDSLTDGQQQAVDLVNEYIYYVEELLGGSSVTYTISEYDGELSKSYQYSMVISYTDLSGGNIEYKMYYNETQTGTKTDKDEVETNYQISGILVVNGEEYPVMGGRNEESETDETSSEIWFRAYTDDNSYIQIEQEYEEETEDGQLETEQTTGIYFYTDGILTESVVAETESEEGETELELEITKDGVKSTLEFTLNNYSYETVLNVKANIGGTKYSFKIYVENGSYRYVF